MFKVDATGLRKELERFKVVLAECIVEAFIQWAKEDDAYLRDNKGFNTITGNLKSSLGAGVFKDGALVFSTPFRTVANGHVGSQKGRMALQASSAGHDVIEKVMVAGMEYAQYVEDIESKDVLESRRLMNEAEAEKIIERAVRMAESRI